MATKKPKNNGTSTVKLSGKPKNAAQAADMLYSVRAQRLAMQKQVDALQARETELKNYILDTLPKSDATGASGKLARAQLNVVVEPVAEDWLKIHRHIKRTGEFDLLNRALNRVAVRERWENGKTIPGVGKFNNVKVSLTKL
jgi:hypothetical protein